MPLDKAKQDQLITQVVEEMLADPNFAERLRQRIDESMPSEEALLSAQEKRVINPEMRAYCQKTGANLALFAKSWTQIHPGVPFTKI